MLVNQIDFIGKKAYSFDGSDTMISVLGSDILYLHETAYKIVCTDFWSKLLDMSYNVGRLLNVGFRLNKPDMNYLSTWSEVIASEEACLAIANSEKFFKSTLFEDATKINDIFTGSNIIELAKQPVLIELMGTDMRMLNLYRDASVAHEQFLARKAFFKDPAEHTFTVPEGVDKAVFIVIGAGANGGGGSQGGGGGGAGGVYVQQFKALTPGDVFTGSIATTGTTFGDIVTGKGGGAPQDTTPDQKDKIILVSSHGKGRTHGHNMGGYAGGGGGGYGGGDGGAGGYGGGAAYGSFGGGGKGSGDLPYDATGADHTGGCGGNHSRNTGAYMRSGIGGGGGGGGSNISSGQSGDGGGGYGGGGGGGGSASSSVTGYGGKGGSGCIVVIY